jgi:ABC-type transport system involved in cytochrome c biogenesis permease subunit
MWTKFEDQAPLVIFLSIVFTLLGATVAAHFLLSSKNPREPTRRIASWVAAAVSALVALVATMAFAIPALDDFHDPHVRFREALVGSAIVWAICLCAWVIAVRCVIFALRAVRRRP